MRAINQIKSVLSTIVAAVVLAMVMVGVTGADTHKESDGLSVAVSLTATVTAKQVAFVEGWLGVTVRAGVSGDSAVLDISPVERQFTVPSGLGASKGDIVYIDVTDLTGHTPDDSAYALAAAADHVAYFKCTSDQDGTEVTGIVLAAGALAS